MPRLECFAAGVQFARTEGIVPAPELNHAVKAAIDEALRCKNEGKSETHPVQPVGPRPFRHAGLYRTISPANSRTSPTTSSALDKALGRNRPRWRQNRPAPFPYGREAERLPLYFFHNPSAAGPLGISASVPG